MMQSQHFIYLLREREFIRLKEHVYKLGRTNQEPSKRFANYPKDSEIVLVKKVDNCKEKEALLLGIFREQFKHRQDIGAEYFEGNVTDMIKLIEKKLVEKKLIKCDFCRISMTKFSGSKFCCGIFHYHCIDQIRKCSTCKTTYTPITMFITDERLLSMFNYSKQLVVLSDLESADVVAVFGDKHNGGSVNTAYRSIMMNKPTYLFIDPSYSYNDRMFFNDLNEMCKLSIAHNAKTHTFFCFRTKRLNINEYNVSDTVLSFDNYLENAPTWRALNEEYYEDD